MSLESSQEMLWDRSSITKLLFCSGQDLDRESSSMQAGVWGAGNEWCWSQCESPCKPQLAGSWQSSHRAAVLSTKASTKSQGRGEDTGVPCSSRHLGRGQQQQEGGTQHTVHRSAAFSALGLTKSAWTAFNISHYLPVLLSPYPELLQASLEEKEYCSLSGPPLPQDWCRWCFFLFTAKAWEVGCSTERNLTVIFSCFNTARVGRDRSCTGHTLVTGHRTGWSWETRGESGLPTVLLQRVKLYLNISHSCSVNLLFICNPFKPFPSNITKKCHSSGPKGTVQTDLTVLFLTPSDPNTDNYWHQTEQEVSCCSWSQLF